MGLRLETRGELDEGRLAERGAEEADAHRHPEHVRGRDLDDRVTGTSGEAGAREDEVVRHDEVGRPRGAVGRRDDGVEVELAERLVDAVDPGVVVDRESLVVGHSTERGLRVVRRVGTARVHGLSELEDLLEEVRHLGGRVRAVERDRVGERLVRHRNADARREVFLQVDLEVVHEDEELAVRRGEGEFRGVEVDHRRAGALDGRDRVVERRDDLRRRIVDALSRHADSRTPEAVHVNEYGVVSGECRPRFPRALPSERYAGGGGITRVGCAAREGVQQRGRIGDGARVRTGGVLRVRDRHDPRAAGKTDRRLDPDDRVHVGRADDAAVCLCADGDRREVRRRGCS